MMAAGTARAGKHNQLPEPERVPEDIPDSRYARKTVRNFARQNTRKMIKSNVMAGIEAKYLFLHLFEICLRDPH